MYKIKVMKHASKKTLTLNKNSLAPRNYKLLQLVDLHGYIKENMCHTPNIIVEVNTNFL